MKRKYTPTPFHNKDNTGKHIKHRQRAEYAATYLSETQWGNTYNEETQQINQDSIIQQEGQQYKTTPPDAEEIKTAIRKLKRRKAPGPDEIPTELLKELNTDNLEEMKKLFEMWWNQENIDLEELKARVVLI